MNLSADQASVADEIIPPPQPHRLSTSCDLHPDERFSGFCPSCLCDRLSVLDHNAAPPPSSSRKPPTISAAALKALFKPSSSGTNNNPSNGNGRVRPGFFPELRRTKSFSAKNNEGIPSAFEPQRRSCDVRLRDVPTKEADTVGRIEDETRKSSVSETVLEVNEETEIEEVAEDGGHAEIVKDSDEIVEEEEELKPMKDYMDLCSQTKKPSVKDFAGSFFSAASVFSKKLQKWRQKQKVKKPRSGGDGGGGRPQSEIGYGRRSSDTDPRFSLDAGRFSVDIGRISMDDSRYSIDEPRASWDGHLIGRTTAVRVPPPPSMLSVVENAPANRSDMQIPIQEPSINPTDGESDPIIIIPGGSNQTRDYYTEAPSSRRRKSLDRSNSIRKIATELDDVKSVSNSKVSPATPIESNSMETEENKGNQNGEKKSRRWGKWSILGFIYRKGVNKDDEEEDRYSRSNSAGMVERSTSESWPEMRNGEGGPKMRRSNSNVSWRSSGGGSSRNKSSRYSSKDGENGMLRFYLTPSWRTGGGSGGGGGGGGWEKTAARANSHGHSIARRVMRLY
ncbi:hypothetical protein CARUB_v10000597mg [Capsella rubella]|uniref:Uncharacterized protein n=1 Tax=Capsella rubella TaxID=81985 RepID=R0GTS1_9BRAS|nr:UPF0503 protein At3g09070, chloroplastic [Capsella rubella]EOA20289.1 hypothetical protein CARUB_v10000597mg [Capsella rubella]